mmetsp:Transcript_154885/g.496297  ORF Transcript_154885/g.496297 Transcript_154885/m.496297 type:complete len:227 (+) Transcript_154885:2229-2909(+)
MSEAADPDRFKCNISEVTESAEPARFRPSTWPRSEGERPSTWPMPPRSMLDLLPAAFCCRGILLVSLSTSCFSLSKVTCRFTLNPALKLKELEDLPRPPALSPEDGTEEGAALPILLLNRCEAFSSMTSCKKAPTSSETGAGKLHLPLSDPINSTLVAARISLFIAFLSSKVRTSTKDMISGAVPMQIVRQNSKSSLAISCAFGISEPETPFMPKNRRAEFMTDFG